jgi:hypothetical protein
VGSIPARALKFFPHLIEDLLWSFKGWVVVNACGIILAQCLHTYLVPCTQQSIIVLLS